MNPWVTVLSLAHWIGLALGVGAATIKLTLLLRCRSDRAFAATFLEISKPITRQIILGIMLLTVSGVGWLLLGHDLSPRLWVKIGLVAALWVLGPVIDNVIEPRFRKAVSAAGATESPAYAQALGQYVAWEVTGTLLFYVVIVLWTIR